MSDDVLITPASRKIEFKDSSGNIDGKIELDSAGNLVLTAPGGGIEIGDSSSDIFVGNGTANIDIIFEQNGEIRGTTGRTVTLGQSDSNITVDALNFTTSTSTLFKSQSGITSNRTGIGTSISASTDISSYTAPHTIESTNPGSTQYALLATLPATSSATLDHIVIEGDMGLWNDTHSFRIKMGRRDNFKYDYTIFDHNPSFNRASIVAYQASNGTVTIHAKLASGQYGKVTYTITHSYQVTVVDKPSLTTSTPAGTLIFDSDDTSTYPPTMRFPDNQKLEFGAAADLRIYHDGSNSIIEDNGTGSLQLKGTVNINNAYTLPTADGNSSQVLATNGSGQISFQSVGSLSGSGIQNVSDDTSPQLGGDLSTANNEIHLSNTSGVAIKTTGNLSSTDLTLLRASSASSQDGQYGFDIKYMGSRSGNANSFALEMHNQTGTNVEAITVYQDGKVGINNTTPSAPLDVSGNAEITGTLTAGEVSATTLDIGGTNITATATEINKLDGVTATTAELNYLDITTLGTVEASKVVTANSSGNVKFPDNEILQIGDNGELEILNNGTNSVIRDVGTGSLSLQSNGNEINMWDGANGQYIGQFTPGGSVSLYHNGAKKIETSGSGATVTGTLTAGTLIATGGAQVGSSGLSTIGTGTFGSLSVGSSGITFDDGSVQTAAGASQGFAIAMGVALG